MVNDRGNDVELASFKRQESVDEGDLDRAESQAFINNHDHADKDDIGVDVDGESIATATLSWQEKRNLVLLFCLNFIHVLPLTFSWQTMPLLLRQSLSYTLVGTYLVAQYPYSVKVLWSPIVQSKYIPVLGRRKTWLVPSFFLGGVILFWLGRHQDDLVARTASGESDTLLWLVFAWFWLTVLSANIRIALDDWSLDLLTPPNVHWASATVTISELTANFFSFNLFLGLSSLGNPNAGGKGESSKITTKPYFYPCAVAFVTVALVVLLLQRDGTQTSPSTKPPQQRSLHTSYTIILHILRLPQVWTLMAVHLTSMIGFQTNDAIAVLQLVKNGFTDRDIAGLATISVPLEILGGVLITRRFRKHSPLHVWRTLFPYRLGVALCTQTGVLLISYYRTHHWRWFIALVPYLASKQLEDMMFIAIMSFHTQIADARYGGIYLPLLATTLNIRYDTMGFIYTKTIGWLDGGEDLTSPTPNLIDGYQIVNLLAVVIACPVFWWFLRPATKYLQSVERRLWRIDGVDDDDDRNHGRGVDLSRFSGSSRMRSRDDDAEEEEEEEEEQDDTMSADQEARKSVYAPVPVDVDEDQERGREDHYHHHHHHHHRPDIDDGPEEEIIQRQHPVPRRRHSNGVR